MDVYLRATPSTPRLSVAHALMTVADLYYGQFLTLDSKVWINADRLDQGMWTLTDRSNHVAVISSPHAGWIKLRKGGVSWGLRQTDAQSNPTQVVNIDAMVGDRQRDFTIIVAHREPGKQVKVLTPKHQQRKVVDGECYEPPYRIIDLPSFTRDVPPSTPNDFDVAHAMINGTAILAVGLGAYHRKDVMDNVADYRIDCDETFLTAVASPMREVEDLSGKIIDAITARLRSHGAAPLEELDLVEQVTA